jgi:RimJ/RimL family protein N-acetyltransferase
MAHYKKLIGEKVYLSPVSMDDVDIFMKWVNDGEVVKYIAIENRIFSLLLEKEAVEKMAKGGNTFTIVDLDTDKVIGNCSFFGENTLNRTAEIGIMIGEKDYWGKGYGADALRCMLEFGFNVRNYHNVCLYAVSFNERAIACYEKVGFKRQGVCRESVIRGSKKYDLIYLDILATEWR